MSILTLKFKRRELLYDVKSTAYTMSDVMPDDAGHQKHQLADIGDDGNKDRVTRILDLEMSRCTEDLYAYTKKAVTDNMELNDVLRETDEYKMQLAVNENFSQTSAAYLENLIHNYLVYRVLYEWLNLIDMSDADKRKDRILLKANELMDEIHRALFARINRTRRPTTPF